MNASRKLVAIIYPALGRRRDRILLPHIRKHGICPGVAAALSCGRIVPRRRPARIVSRLGWHWLRWLNGIGAERARFRIKAQRKARR